MTKKNYIQPSIEAMTVNAISNVCANSTTENFNIVDPGTTIGADEGR